MCLSQGGAIQGEKPEKKSAVPTRVEGGVGVQSRNGKRTTASFRRDRWRKKKKKKKKKYRGKVTAKVRRRQGRSPSEIEQEKKKDEKKKKEKGKRKKKLLLKGCWKHPRLVGGKDNPTNSRKMGSGKKEGGP